VLLDRAPTEDLLPACQFCSVRATVENVRAASAHLIPRLGLYDDANQLVGSCGQAAVDVPAGGSVPLTAVTGVTGAPVPSRSPSVSAPAAGTTSAAFEWTPNDAQSGGYLVRAWAECDGQRHGPWSKMLDVGAAHVVLLPVIVK
jgi:hypothetical protein